MPTICRLIQLSPEDVASLEASPGSLSDPVGSAKSHSDVYRYWHAIEFLLARHRPGSAAARWLSTGTAISPEHEEVPGARLLAPEDVQELDADLSQIEPDDLIPHYDAATLDAARVYPATWEEWEEDFDPLGQVLEHYSFLKQFVSRCARAGAGMLLHFGVLAEGTV